MLCFVVYDSYAKSLIGLYDNLKDVEKLVNKLVRDDINNEIVKLKYSILSENNVIKRQELCMTLENLKVQLSLDDVKNCYILNGDIKQRYLHYSKEMNKLDYPIFLYAQ